MKSGGSPREEGESKDSANIKYHRFNKKKKKRARSHQRSFISREKMSGPQIILIPPPPVADAQSGRPQPWLATRLLQLRDIFLTVLTQPNFMWTLHVFSWLSGTNPSGLRLELLGPSSRPNYTERRVFVFFFSLRPVPFKFRRKVTHITGTYHRN